MIVSINQPAYLPWLGYFHRIAASDVHVVLDHVQYEKNSFVNRNKIRTKPGSCWLTVPLKTAGRFGQLSISNIEIANEHLWCNKHWTSIRLSYSKAPYFRQHADFFENLFCRSWPRLDPFLRESTSYLLDAFGIRTKIVFSSDLQPSTRKSELVLELCMKLGATLYFSGSLGRNYLDERSFQRAGIEIEYQNFQHPTYTQMYPGFEPFMSAIDLLFNYGPNSLNVVMQGQIRLSNTVGVARPLNSHGL